MKISCLWLKEWIDHSLSPEELCAGLTSLGLETSIAADKRGAYRNVVVGKVGSVKPHPNADNIRLTEVDVGKEKLSIVCGAPNIAAGQTVAVALVGANLPNGMKIEKRKIRGELSLGMICSESELGISAESSGILVLEDSLEAGNNLADCIEIEDTILEVDLTPNRGDCLSILGVAREVAALTGGRVKLPSLPIPEKEIGGFTARLENASSCPRYTACEITGVRIAPSPFKIRRRLLVYGIRPINNVVDITNYVMLETGHPLHAFDRRDLGGNSIVIRNATMGESFTTLDGKSHVLTDSMLLIADTQRGVALAGIMGGKNSEVKDDTTDIILEAAYFDPLSIRRTAKRLGMGTESSYRFERGVDPEGVPLASLMAARSIALLGEGTIGGFMDRYPAKIIFPKIRISTRRANDILGLELDDGLLTSHLERLGFEVKKEGAGTFLVHVPTHRHDIKAEIDLIEEISRLHGYDNIPATSPRLAQHDSLHHGQYTKRRELNRLLADAGLFETINYSFIAPAWRKTLGMGERVPPIMENRINADLNELRTTLLPGLMQTAAFNLRQGEETVSLFETGTVFHATGNEVEEEFLCAGVITCGSEEILNVKLGRDFFRMKGILAKTLRAAYGVEPVFQRPPTGDEKKFLYDHRQAVISLNGRAVGFMGQLHPAAAEPFQLDAELVCFELSVNAATDAGVHGTMVHPIPRLPGIKRDLALLVDERVETGGIVRTILDTDDKRIRHCKLFDLYQGPQVPLGKKSLAFRLFFLDTEKTLTDETGDSIIKAVLERVKERHGAELRV